jgi:hypothetical protein
MKIHLGDGTYELFRSFFGAPSKKAPDGREVGATLGLLNSLLALLTKSGATHLACAFIMSSSPFAMISSQDTRPVKVVST